jgi:hypothetical protein
MATRFYSNVEYGSSGRGSNDPDYIYYNATIVNNNIANSDPNGFNGVGNYDDPQVVFNDMRQQPIMQNPSDYNMSVIRFDLAGATKSLPLFIPRIVPNQPNRDLTVYNVTVNVNVVSGAAPPLDNLIFFNTQPVIWESENVTPDNLPPEPVVNQNLSTDYYYCNTYQSWAVLVNKAVALAYATVLTQLAAISAVPAEVSTSPPPRLFFNPVDRLFSWSFDARFWGADHTNTALTFNGVSANFQFNVGLDCNLETLLTNFRTGFVSGVEALLSWGTSGVSIIRVDGQQIAIDIDPTTGLPYTTPNATGHVRYVVTQDYGSISGCWSPCDSIVITSTKLPITPEFVAPAPGLVGASDFGINVGTTGSAIQPIIADVQVGHKGADDWRGYILYDPQAEYRMLSLGRSTDPLVNVDLFIWWRNRYDNNLYPLRLYNGSSVSVKILFRRKGVH